jgi:Spy/CpxP family protein refolding chaperone
MKKILILLAFTAGLYAQDRGDKEAIMKQRMEASKEQREAWIIGTMTKHLDLTSEQATKFFPLQNEFHKKSEEAKKAHSTTLRELRSAAKDDRSKFDVDAAINSKVRMKGTLARLESKFLKDTKGILTKDQRIKLLFFDERMKSNLAKEMKERKGSSAPKGGAKRGFDSNKKRR